MYAAVDPIVIEIILGFPIYLVLEIIIRRAGYPTEMKPRGNFFPKWKRKKEWTLLVSPGYYLARYYKNRTKYFHHRSQEARAKIIKADNRNNWLFSASLFIVTVFAPYNGYKEIISYLTGILFWRFISRSFEISYAFGKDVVEKEKNSSGLNKHTRIRLALISYSEIYLYSASFYVAFPPTESTVNATMIALNVGSLTNVGYVFAEISKVNQSAFFVFIQVFATLSLVVLSLASYMSRSDAKNA